MKIYEIIFDGGIYGCRYVADPLYGGSPGWKQVRSGLHKKKEIILWFWYKNADWDLVIPLDDL